MNANSNNQQGAKCGAAPESLAVATGAACHSNCLDQLDAIGFHH
jgi:hypothetical protein